MAKYYILDVGVFGRHEWQSSKQEVEARSAEAAAIDFISNCAEACVDGQGFEVVVAEEEDGSDARLYKGHCRITCDFLIDRSNDYKIEPPEDEDE